MRRNPWSLSPLAGLMAGVGGAALMASAPVAAAETACKGDQGGLSLPPGFCASVFADGIGHARQMVAAPDGTLYVNTWSGRYYKNDTPPPGGFLVALKDTNGDGKADVVERFGETQAEGGAGGTGIGLYDGAVYAEINDRIMRYPLKAGEVVPKEAGKGQGEVVVSGLPLTGDHPMHPFAITPKGEMLVDLGSATNACEVKNRVPGSVGNEPCTEKETRGGIWRYDAKGRDQAFSPAARYVSGIRNGEGIALDAEGRVYSTQHGRDQLHEDWPKLYTQQQGFDLPSEEVVELKQGADYGWPECYFDPTRTKLVLAPEYGGDGGKKVGVCSGRQGPVAWFPAHWAPNDMKFYVGPGTEAKGAFPKAYRNGAFIAFHGSWNRAPGPQGGYVVMFQPMKDGKAAGKATSFADGFAGPVKEPGRATYRPTGLAVAPDGALYISDDVKGRIWRVTYAGADADAPVAAAPAPKVGSTASRGEGPPEGMHPDAGRAVAATLPVPKGATRQQVALGERVFHGEVGGATCGGCHGSDAKGSPIGADLTTGHWLWSDGSLAGLE
ncbi:hypothetical protein KHHGKMAE_3649 [Methylobacterium persicinum]|nr:hypothetical protein KHHGKMAE_3649 [Methylobacterium persicinum]